MKRNSILEKRRTNVSEDIRAAVDLSFEIVDRIHDILESKGISQKDFADLLGKKESEISRWMRGTHNFTISTITKIEHALNCKILFVQKQPGLPTMIERRPVVIAIQTDSSTILSADSRTVRYGYLSNPCLKKATKLN